MNQQHIEVAFISIISERKLNQKCVLMKSTKVALCEHHTKYRKSTISETDEMIWNGCKRNEKLFFFFFSVVWQYYLGRILNVSDDEVKVPRELRKVYGKQNKKKSKKEILNNNGNISCLYSN